MDFSKEIDILTSLGFVPFDGMNEHHWGGYDIPVEDGELLFIESETVRQRILVKLSESCNNDVYYAVYVLKDIGCETICMPFNHYYLSPDFLNHLKMSLSGHGFKTESNG